MRRNGKGSIYRIRRKVKERGKAPSRDKRKEITMTQEYFINNETKANEILTFAGLNGMQCYKKPFNARGQGMIKVVSDNYDDFRMIERMLKA